MLKKKSVKNLASDSDRQYLDYLKGLTLYCAVCGDIASDLHHLKIDGYNLHSSSKRKDHKKVVPVCKNHHTGKDCSFHGNKRELQKAISIDKLNEISHSLYQEFLDSGIDH